MSTYSARLHARLAKDRMIRRVWLIAIGWSAGVITGASIVLAWR